MFEEMQRRHGHNPIDCTEGSLSACEMLGELQC